MTSNFDRLRPRAPHPTGTAGPSGHDTQGKRVLFSATEAAAPSVGSVVVDCSRCRECTVMSLGKTIRSIVPSLHLGLRVGRGEDVRKISVLKHDYPTYMRCPACGRPSWVRFTVQL
jgi:hypothetical protein